MARRSAGFPRAHVLIAGALLAAAGCRAARGGASQAATDEQPVHERAAFAASPDGNRHRLEDQDVTPELQQKAVAILRESAGAPLGTEVPFDFGGVHYVGRIERHWDEARGPHPGVTLYIIEKK